MPAVAPYLWLILATITIIIIDWWKNEVAIDDSFDARKQRKFVEREKRRKIGDEEKCGCTKLTTEVNKILMSPVPSCSTSVSPSDWLSALARWWLTRSRHHTSTSEHRTSTTSKTEGWDKVDPAAPPKRSAFDSFKRWRYCKHREKTNDFSLSFFFSFSFLTYE